MSVDLFKLIGDLNNATVALKSVSGHVKATTADVAAFLKHPKLQTLTSSDPTFAAALAKVQQDVANLSQDARSLEVLAGDLR